MTCIVGIVDDGVVWMGGDSAGVCGYSITSRRDPKVYRVGEFLFGYSGSFRMGQVLGYGFAPPHHGEFIDVDRYMRTVFIDALRATLKGAGFAQNNSGTEEISGAFLVGYRGRIFCVEPDYQVAERLDAFDAIGCGSDIALGSLYATKDITPPDRITAALEAAEYFNGGVKGPFVIERTPKQLGAGKASAFPITDNNNEKA
ncbi:MAG: hypothetical protein QM739_17905 [Propionivibrio sp.]